MRARVADAFAFVNTDLPAASAAVGQSTMGPLFQALLASAAKAGVVGGGAAMVSGPGPPLGDPPLAARPASSSSSCRSHPPVPPHSQKYASRDDRTAGAALDLAPLGAARADMASRALQLVELLRIKLEDDGDLDQARKTLRDCETFFEQVEALALAKGRSSTAQLAQLRAC